MPNPQTNLRLDPAIRQRAIAAAAEQGITVATLVERALTAFLDGAGDSVAVDSDSVAGQIADLIARVERLEAIAATPPPPSPAVAPATGQSSTEAAPSGEGLPLPEALVSAGAPIPPDVALGTNRARAMNDAVGMAPAAWLASQGWVKHKGKWYRG